MYYMMFPNSEYQQHNCFLVSFDSPIRTLARMEVSELEVYKYDDISEIGGVDVSVVRGGDFHGLCNANSYWLLAAEYIGAIASLCEDAVKFFPATLENSERGLSYMHLCRHGDYSHRRLAEENNQMTLSKRKIPRDSHIFWIPKEGITVVSEQFRTLCESLDIDNVDFKRLVAV
jgi:hypothetical protein